MRIWEERAPRRFTDETLVLYWLNMHREGWWENPRNDFYGYERKAEIIATHWLKNGKHGEDYDDRILIKIMSYWDEFIALFKEVPD